MSKKSVLANWTLRIVLILASFTALFPLVVTITNSLMAAGEIALNYTDKRTVFDILEGLREHYIALRLVPKQFSLGQYADVLLNQPSFLLLLMNSAKLTVPMVAGNVFFSLLSAYGFTLWRGQAANAVFLIYVIVMLMPLQAVIVPNYIVADQLRMRDSYLAIILPGIFAPFGTFLLRQGMKSMPQEYFEAARIDGAGEFTVFLRIVLPQIKSCIAALCMLTFIEYWNLVEQPVIFIRDYARQPLSVYLSRISETRVGVIFAASAVYMLLPLWFLAAGRENLEKGIELSGIK